MIKLENVNKVYRTDRVEPLALENINLDMVSNMADYNGVKELALR